MWIFEVLFIYTIINNPIKNYTIYISLKRKPKGIIT